MVEFRTSMCTMYHRQDVMLSSYTDQAISVFTFLFVAEILATTKSVELYRMIYQLHCGICMFRSLCNYLFEKFI
jgi:hypothetical protein